MLVWRGFILILIRKSRYGLFNRRVSWFNGTDVWFEWSDWWYNISNWSLTGICVVENGKIDDK